MNNNRPSGHTMRRIAKHGAMRGLTVEIERNHDGTASLAITTASGVYQQNWGSYAILCHALVYWRNLRGCRLTVIDNRLLERFETYVRLDSDYLRNNAYPALKKDNKRFGE